MTFDESLPGLSPAITVEPEFTWEIGDDFLETESDKLYLDKFVNYPLKQSSSLYNRNLQMFDHPLMGFLVIVTPYELETEFESEKVTLLP